MPPVHRKLRRKDLKEPDEFMSFLYEAQQYVTGNLTQVIVASAVVAAAAVILVSAYYYERHRDHTAAAQFYQAFQYLDAKQYKLAEQDFAQLSDAEPGRELGRLSRFYLATCYLGENDLPHARNALVEFLAQAHDNAFRSLALMNLADVYERMGDLKKAEGAYREAASIPGAQRATAELAIARIMQRSGDRAGAIDAYRNFLSANPFSPERQDVVETLAQLGVHEEAAPRRAASAIVPPGAAPARIDLP